MKMSKILAAVSAAVMAVSAVSAVSVSAYEPAGPFGIFGFNEDGSFVSTREIEIWKKTPVDKDFTLKEGQDLKIQSLGKDPDTMSVGRLVIKGGSTAEIMGTVYIERGGVLEIEDGTLYIHGGHINNHGTIKIGKNGRLVFRNGSLYSTAAGNIENNGKILCLDSEKDMDGIFKSIKKYDKNFNLSDYSFHMFGRGGGEADVMLNYCINDVQTNYTYKFTIDRNKEKTKIIRKPYDLETVYSKDTEKDILSRREKYEKNYSGKRDFDIYLDRNYGYSYNYKTGKMVYEECWFEFHQEEDGEYMAYDHAYTEKL